MIERRPAAAPLDACVALWQGLALQLTAIIGEGGFESLYNRSAHLARQAHPWLAPSAGRDFGALRDSLAQQDAGQAGEACSALLIFFYRHTDLVDRRALNDQHSTCGLG
ncbi:hypothetical protein CSQ96_22560 [Janthinobacterium sp. BJB412]|nr:hypothetical protein CSQ96_22560 [Janthinobacterium sp. BJB412]